MIIYTIFKNNELIWARNFITKNKEEAIQKIKDTIKDIEKNANVNGINFDGETLEFNSLDEKHVMMIK